MLFGSEQKVVVCVVVAGPLALAAPGGPVPFVPFVPFVPLVPLRGLRKGSLSVAFSPGTGITGKPGAMVTGNGAMVVPSMGAPVPFTIGAGVVVVVTVVSFASVTFIFLILPTVTPLGAGAAGFATGVSQ